MYRFVLDPFIPQWVKPNHITVARIFLTPAVIYFLFIENYAVGVPFFLFVALTDALDGSMARVRRQITEWGIMYDPLADKLLIGSVLFVIVLHHINFLLGIALLVVEVGMIIGGWVRKRRGKIEQANVWGKIKMVAEVCGISLLLIALWLNVNLLVDLSTGTLAVALVVAIVSILSRMR
jgi:CDP-diacylglycerol--glycerol-3-phosphate 3-phosphatidyltransferase